MAQGSKSRIVIWTIVGILVVIAAVMLIKKPKVDSRPPINTERFVRNMETRLQSLEGRVGKARVDAPGAPDEQWQKISDNIASTRRILAEMPGLTEQKDLQAKASDAQDAYAEARKTLKAITGKEDKEEKEGGE